MFSTVCRRLTRIMLWRTAKCHAVTWTLGLFLTATLPAGAVSAETLKSALRSTYLTNPRIEAERANLRATDETVPQARSNYRPRVTLEGDVGVERSKSVPHSPETGTTNPYGYSVSLRQKVFRGFRTINAVNEAEAKVRAGREALRSTEQSVLLDAATAYMNVVRDQGIVSVRQHNVRILGQHLKAALQRFAVSEVTRTDVAQSRARYAGARSNLELARANLRASRANFLRVVGRPPGRLVTPGLPNRQLPKSIKAAIKLAETRHPTVIAALYEEQAARFAVDQVAGELLPSFNIDAQFARRNDPTVLTSRTEVASIFGRLTVPLYQGGEVSSRVRQAKHLHVRRIQLIHQARQQAREEVIAAWSLFKAAAERIKSQKSQVTANRLALDGVSQEENVGQRTLLDVLDAEQELLEAQVQLVSTRRDVIVNAYRLVAAVGLLTAPELHLNSEIYDAKAHYKEVRLKPWGISITYAQLKPAKRHTAGSKR